MYNGEKIVSSNYSSKVTWDIINSNTKQKTTKNDITEIIFNGKFIKNAKILCEQTPTIISQTIKKVNHTLSNMGIQQNMFVKLLTEGNNGT